MDQGEQRGSRLPGYFPRPIRGPLPYPVLIFRNRHEEESHFVNMPAPPSRGGPAGEAPPSPRPGRQLIPASVKTKHFHGPAWLGRCAGLPH